jgi:hypothetical protein
MAHPLVLALYDTAAAASAGAQAVHRLGIDREHLSVVARNHDEEGVLARELDGTPGVEIEDSRLAARLGELSGRILAAIAIVMPGIGPLVAAGPLSARLGEAAGHVAGGVASVLSDAGVDAGRAAAWQSRIEAGAILLGVHAVRGDVSRVRAALEQSGAGDIEIAEWE